jgi:hypothetical protein
MTNEDFATVQNGVVKQHTEMSIKGCCTRKELIDRGWTRRLIERLLDPPTAIIRGRGVYCGRKLYLYAPLIVTHREQSDEFKKGTWKTNERESA